METTEARLAELAPEIADALGWSVSDRSHGHYVRIVGPLKGAELGLSVQYPYSKNGKIKVIGNFPQEAHSIYTGAEQPTIMVSASKTGTQIAKDIERRLFPEYEKLLDIVNEKLGSHRKYESGRDATAKKIAAATGGEVRRHGSQVTVSLYHSEKFPEQLADIQVSDEGVKFNNMYVTADEAVAMLETLARMRR